MFHLDESLFFQFILLLDAYGSFVSNLAILLNCELNN